MDTPRIRFYGAVYPLMKELKMTRSVLRALSMMMALTLALYLAGCKASEAPTSEFIEQPGLMSKNPNSPFQRTYWDKKYDPAAYTELYIAPVNTHYVMAQNFWEKASAVSVTQDQIKADVAAMAQYTRQSFIRAFADDPRHRFKVVDKVGPKTLVLELAITQLVPSKPALNALGYVTWIPTAVAMGSAAASDSQDTGKGVVAIEGRIRDGAGNKVIGMFADREAPKTAIVDIKALNWWAPAKAIVDEWSSQLVEIANKPGGSVKDSPTFEMLIW